MTTTGGTGTGGSVVATGHPHVAEVAGWTAPRLSWAASGPVGLSAAFVPSHVPIVIGASPGFPLLGGVERVPYASVMLVLLAIARSVRLAANDARNTAGATTGGPDTSGAADPTDLGRVA